MFMNDCFFSMDSGLPWFDLLGSKNTQEEITLRCRQIILQSYGVLRISRLSVSVSSDRNIILDFNIDTIYTKNLSQVVELSPSTMTV
jgi:hypothetical protein